MTRAKRLLIARVAIVVLLGALAFAGTASAEPAAAPAPEAVPPVTESGGEASPPVQLVVEPVPEPPPPVESVEPGKETPPAEGVVEPVTETPPAEAVVEPVTETPLPAEAVVEPVTETPLPAEAVSEPVHEDVPPAEAVKEPSPEAGPIVTPTPEAAIPVVLATEQAKEALSTGGGDQAAEGVVSVSTSAQEGPPASGPTIAEGVVTAPAPVSATASQEQERSPSLAPAILASVRLTAAQRAADLSCELSGLPGSLTGECAAGFAGEQRSTASTASLVAVPATTGTGAPPGGGYSGSTGGSRSAAPPPGPAPSGAFGGSAAGGAGGALSGFFTLAGLLLLAGPRAMRRLRLSCRPWLTAFFVLIPERPG
jgi:hypothetical protein